MLHVALPITLVGSMPFAFTAVAKAGHFTMKDNEQTRLWQAQLTGWRQRAYWAHQNAFEAIPLFAAMAITAHLARPGSSVAAAAAWTFVGLRVLYGILYIAGKGSLRSTAWLASQGAILALLLVSLGVIAQ
jgi:uncharacterized MAPEG superfamily protein